MDDAVPAEQIAPVDVAEAGPDAAAPEAIHPGDEVRVRLADGQELRGVVAALEPGFLVLHIADGRAVWVAWDAVEIVLRDVRDRTGTAYAWRDPNVTRYFYAPSAFTLPRGTGYVSQKQLVFTTAAVGVTDWLGLEVGTIVPLLFTPARVGIVGAKVGVPVGPRLRIGAGTQLLGAIVDGTLGGGGFVFANATYGTADSHLTVGAGPSVAFFDGEARFGPVAVVGAGNHRLRDNLAIVTENWLFVDRDEVIFPSLLRLVPSGGVRFMGERFAVDVGVVVVWTGASEIPVVPIPWLDFTWNFQ